MLWTHPNLQLHKKLISSSVMKYLSGPSESMLEYKR